MMGPQIDVINNPEFGKKPSEVDALLRFSIHSELLRRFVHSFGDLADLISSAVIHYAMVEIPTHEDVRRFGIENCTLVEQQASFVHFDHKIAYAFTILCALTLVRLGPKSPNRPEMLAVRATELHIELQTTKQIFDTGDASIWLAVIHQFASDLLKVDEPLCSAPS